MITLTVNPLRAQILEAHGGMGRIDFSDVSFS